MSIPRISPEEAQAHLAAGEGWIYLDVRTQAEFVGGHPAGAVNVPVALRTPEGLVPNPDFLTQVAAVASQDAKLITGCLRGGRSLRAAGLLVEGGWTGVVDMRGGWDAELDQTGAVTYPGWTQRGLPISR